MNFHSSFQSVSDLHFVAKMEDESRPEKKLKLDNSNNCEQDEIRRLKEVVKELEDSLATRNQKLVEMKESNNKVEREKAKVEEEKAKVERDKSKVEEEKNKVEEKNMKLEEDKNKIEGKLRKLVECPVCLLLPRKGPVPCCTNGHLVCSTCLGKLRAESKLEQG